MPKYIIRMTRDTSQSVDMIVTADNINMAEDRAYQETRSDRDLPWEDDEYAGNPYCSNFDDVEEYDPSLHPVSDGYHELP